MKATKVAIVGGGPSSAFSLLALRDWGVEDVTLFASKIAVPTGAFWIHEIPGSSWPKIWPRELLTITRMGTAAGYSTKMWGKVVPTSFPEAGPEQHVVYDPYILVPSILGTIPRVDCGFLADEQIHILARDYDLTIVTFPLERDKELRDEPRRFPVWSTSLTVANNLCLYNGLSAVPWVRQTAAFGQVCVEYPKDTPPREIRDFEEVRWGKSRAGTIAFYPDLNPDEEPLAWEEQYSGSSKILLVGRYATWDRKALSHDSYYSVVKALEEMRN